MSHLTQPEAAKCVNGFFLYLFGRENYKRWKDLKAKVKFKSEPAFVSWLLDSGEIISESCNSDFPPTSTAAVTPTTPPASTPPHARPLIDNGVCGASLSRRRKSSKAKKRSNSESSCGTASDDVASINIKSEADDEDDLYDHPVVNSEPPNLVNSTFSDSVPKPLSALDDFSIPGVTSTLGLGLGSAGLTDDLFGFHSSLDDTIDFSSDPLGFPYSSNLLNSLNLDQTFQLPSTSKGTKKFKLSDAQSREYEHVMELRKTFASVHKNSPGAAAASCCKNQFKLTYTAISSTTVLVSIGDKSPINGMNYPVQCDLCGGQDLGSERLLVNHAKKCHQINPFLCEACSKRFATKPSIESHIFWSCSAVDSDKQHNILNCVPSLL